MVEYGPNITAGIGIDPKVFIVCALLVQWFSQVDMMDGLRARRLKVGSPLGRMIDEAGDTIVMSNYSTLMAYMLVFDNKYWELAFFYLNCGFFGEETRYKICKQLVLTVAGEIGSVEIEIIIASCFLFGGIYGSEGL